MGSWPKVVSSSLTCVLKPKNMFEIFLFFLIIFSSFQTIRSLNIIYAVLQLLITYCLVGLLLIVYNLDFFAVTYIIVCAGGVGILFLFIIMTLERVSYYQLVTTQSYFTILPLLIVFLIPFFYFLYTFFINSITFDLMFLMGYWDNYTYKEFYGTNFMELGNFLYFYNSQFIWLNGFILFFSLIASVFLVYDGKNKNIDDK